MQQFPPQEPYNPLLEPSTALDAYQIAERLGITPEEAAKIAHNEGWQFGGYTMDGGQACWTPPVGRLPQ